MDGVGDVPRLLLPDACVAGLQSAIEAHVWLIDVRGLQESTLSAWGMALLGEDEQRRARAIVSRSMRRDHLAGRVVLRLLLSAYCPDIPPQGWLVSRAAGGRPIASAPHGDGLPVPSFSISHNEGHLALAFHEGGEPGVDIESLFRDVDARGLARRYFSFAETRMLEALSGEVLRTAFLRSWTLKEASVKADGVGLAGELARREFVWSRDGRIQTGSPDERHWQYWSWTWKAAQVLAVALRHRAGWQGRPALCRPFTLSLPDGDVSQADVTDGHASAVV